MTRYARPPLAVPHLRRPLHRRRFERTLSREPREGPDRVVGRLRSADADRIRQRSRSGAGRGRQGGRADQPSRRYADAVQRDPAGADEHVDDDQRDGGLAAGALCRGGGGAGGGRFQTSGDGAERHHQGISVAGHIRLPAGAVLAADRRHRGLDLFQRAKMEPDERLFLPFAGGGGDAGAGTGLRARHGDCGSGYGEGAGRCVG